MAVSVAFRRNAPSMSRFRPRSSPSGGVVTPSEPARPVQVAPPFRFERRVESSAVPLKSAEPVSNMVQRLGFWILCGYLISGTLNEWALRLAGIKGYLSIITLVLLPVAWLACGSPFRGLRLSMGWWWTGFLCWMLLATPASVWPGGTFAMLINYIPRSYMLFFFVAALAISFRHCQKLIYVNVVASFMTLLTVVKFGTSGEDGRYRVPGGAGFFDNSNELAMQLLIGITLFVFLFSQKSIVGKFIALLGLGLSIPYLLWTGSRGGLIGSLAYLVVLLFTARHRLRALVVVAALGVMGVVFTPSAALHRLTLLSADEEISVGS